MHSCSRRTALTLTLATPLPLSPHHVIALASRRTSLTLILVVVLVLASRRVTLLLVDKVIEDLKTISVNKFHSINPPVLSFTEKAFHSPLGSLFSAGFHSPSSVSILQLIGIVVLVIDFCTHTCIPVVNACILFVVNAEYSCVY
ncbi:hypothetical protein VNO78_24178 [Psophocarpus tetragonolobus]|uniref:Uncharacterized protein n=1 Tax=Psophocarpus tetragonolobus TaxID=3891 RepID=A0AAN9S5G5_PSOTE